MNLLFQKFKDVIFSVFPITIIVVLLRIFLVPMNSSMMIRFFVGAIFIIVGLGVFLLGAEIGITRVGEHMGEYVATSKTVGKVLFLGLFLGIIITIAEPDLMILAKQVAENVKGISSSMIVIIVSVGVGIMMALGFLRILKGFSLNHFFLIFYGIILCLFFFVSEEFRGIAFDSSGATTGAMTTPFILAMGLGVSKLKGSSSGEKDSFGLVGIASIGPILAIMIMSILVKSSGFSPSDSLSVDLGFFQALWTTLSEMVVESLIALLPISIVFYIINGFVFKLPSREIRRISFGLIYTLIGLVLFLTGVNFGFMEVAKTIGATIALVPSKAVLPALGLILGMVVVLAEPAVYVLSQNVEDVTGGYISKRMILISLSIGVSIAVALSLLRIIVPEIKLWMFIIPGFIIAITLSQFIPQLFVGIAFDAGGVASGPMTATFILAFAQGAAATIPTADVLLDGFGIIAMVAMTPIIAISTLGLLYKIKTKKVGV